MCWSPVEAVAPGGSEKISIFWVRPWNIDAQPVATSQGPSMSTLFTKGVFRLLAEGLASRSEIPMRGGERREADAIGVSFGSITLRDH